MVAIVNGGIVVTSLVISAKILKPHDTRILYTTSQWFLPVGWYPFVFFNYYFSELRTDDRRIHRPSPIEFSERNPYPDRQFESHRIPSHISDWNTIRRPLSQQSDNTRRVLEPSADTNGYHPTGKNHWLVVYSMRVSCGNMGVQCFYIVLNSTEIIKWV
jgi:hypothetical protein